jgi:hypothetical protein
MRVGKKRERESWIKVEEEEEGSEEANQMQINFP